MKKLKLLLVVLLFPFIASAQSQQTVYQEIIFEDLTGNQLLDSLAYYYTTPSVLSYNAVRDLMFTQVYNDNNIVECIYTGDLITINSNSTTPRQDALNQGFNTEHVWPQSRGAGSGNPRSDMHHLRPIRADVNSSRGNFPFGYIEPNLVSRWWKGNSSQTNIPSGDLGTWSRTGNSRFQVRDKEMGDIARAMFYFYAIYRTEADAADPNYFVNQMQDLRGFHNQQAVTQLEVDRTYLIANVQGGFVNPFVLDTTLVRRAFFEDFDPGVLPPVDPGQEGDYFVDFEGLIKSSYATGNVDLNGITWEMANALAGAQTSDIKFGDVAARLRRQVSASADAAALTMLQDKEEGLGVVSFFYSRSLFSGDRAGNSPSFVVEYSVNQGQTWTQTGPTVDLNGVDQLTQFSTEIATEQNGRIRIRTISGDDGKRFNIDNISISNFPYVLLPSVANLEVSDITDSELILTAEVTNDGGATVNERGFVFAERLINDDPVLEDDDVTIVIVGTGTGTFSANITGLLPDTEYALRAYATNSTGTIYTEEIFVFTLLSSSTEEDPETPNQVTLNQNYPNPFNPSTQISFVLPQAQQVELTVYDINGRVISKLLNQQMAAGSHSVSFDASSLSSGIYLYRLNANGISFTRKMTLTK